jgi:Arc/MetJ-type ribon-helix-helix transcriptional regulator
MSKITFRADEALVERVEALDASKSEVMREALRAYLDRSHEQAPRSESRDAAPDSIDDVVARRVDALVSERLEEAASARDVNVNVTLDGAGEVRTERAEPTPSDAPRDHESDDHTCAQCGESLSDDYVFCPNCGEKAAHRFFCECGDELRSDWSHCPSCGRRTPSAEVLDK